MVITTGLGLLVAYLKRLTRKQRLPQWAQYLRDGLLFPITRVFYRRATIRLSLGRYARLRLGDERLGQLLTPGKEPTILSVDDAYIPLVLQTSGTTLLNEEVVRAGPRVLVTGDPGSGKSSLLRYILRHECQRAVSSPKNAFLPLLIELRDFIPPSSISEPSDLGSWSLDRLYGTFRDWNIFRPDECLRAQIDSGRLIVMFDGLDEVGFNNHAAVLGALTAISNRLTKANPRNLVIVTMRTQFAHLLDATITREFPVTCHLAPLTPGQIYDFLVRWPFDQRRAVTEISRIYDHLTAHPTLFESCTNPLVLSMYVALDQRTSDYEAPETRTGFFSEVATELLERRRARQHRGLTARVALRQEREAVLGRIALAHITDSGQVLNSIPWSSAIAAVQEVNGLGPSEAETYFDDLAIETGIVVEDRPRDSVRFIHLLFCEYMAALEAAVGQEGGVDRLVEFHRHFMHTDNLATRLLETIPFSCALLPRMAQKGGFASVRALGDPGLTLRCYVEAQAYASAEWAEVQSELAGTLLAIEPDAWDAAWFDRLALFERSAAQAKLVRRPTTTDWQANMLDIDAFFGRLVNGDRERAMILFEKYFTRSPRAAFPVAASLKLNLVEDVPEVVIGQCAEPAFLSYAVTQAVGSGRIAAAWQMVLAEASLRHGLIARRLTEAPRGEIVSPIAREKRRHEWRSVGPVRGTVYGECLTTAVASPRLSLEASTFRELARLARVPAPYFLYRVRSLLGPLLLWCTIFPLLLILAAVGGSVLSASPLQVLSASLVGCLTLLSFSYLARRASRRPFGMVIPSSRAMEALFARILNVSTSRDTQFPVGLSIFVPRAMSVAMKMRFEMVTTIRRQVNVAVSPEIAFRLFTEDMDEWYVPDDVVYWAEKRSPRIHVTLGQGVGGKWTEWNEYGSWPKGEVLGWEPGHRLVVRFITVELPPNLATHLDVLFEDDGELGTVVTLDHSGFDIVPVEYWRYVSPNGWANFLAAYQKYTSQYVVSNQRSSSIPH